MGKIVENENEPLRKGIKLVYGKEHGRQEQPATWFGAIEKSKREEEEGRHGMIDPGTMYPGARQFTNSEEEEYSEEEEDALSEESEFSEEDRRIIRSLYLEAHKAYGYMPTIKEFRSFIATKGVNVADLSYDALSGALSEVFQPHGGSENLSNLRSPGQGPGKISAVPGRSGPSGPRGSGKDTYPPNQRFQPGGQGIRSSGGYRNPTSTPAPTPMRSRGLGDEEARAQFYGQGHQQPFTGGTNPPRQAYTSYPDPFRNPEPIRRGTLSPLTKSMINETFQKSVARTDEEERQRMLEETVTSPKPPVFRNDELENTHGLKPRLIEESESDEEAAVRYAEEAQRVRSGPKGNWALADQLEETAKRLRGSAMQKRRRAVAHDIQHVGQGTSFSPYNIPF